MRFIIINLHYHIRVWALRRIAITSCIVFIVVGQQTNMYCDAPNKWRSPATWVHGWWCILIYRPLLFVAIKWIQFNTLTYAINLPLKRRLLRCTYTCIPAQLVYSPRWSASWLWVRWWAMDIPAIPHTSLLNVTRIHGYCCSASTGDDPHKNKNIIAWIH